MAQPHLPISHAAAYDPEKDWPWSPNFIPSQGRRKATPTPVIVEPVAPPLRATSHLSGRAVPRPSVLGEPSLNREVIL